LKIVTDIFPDKGALGGLFTGLTASKSLLNLVVAADMPFLNKSLLRYMIHLAEGFDVVVPKEGDKLEPLHAVYSQCCMAPIEHMLKCNNLKIQEMFPLLKVRYIDNREMERLDPLCLSIFNINTPTDLFKARELVKPEMRANEFFCV
jgi:molybdopterin-guanine dinucleotide biosynthesis protein A